ncbi:MAG: ribose transport system ATP-binding protein [Thermotogaceae bacterium]|uniref:sugar ABC transporter ATP-binding protein n=1 Tax=Thermotoga petrophila TaxID=93929 RepID=UPI00264AEECD|nr:ribose transport system ATP-binding protein [Thermotogaceae bacterium]
MKVLKEVVIRLKDISKEFSGVEVLKNINLDIYRGEIHAIVGENGAGKSTLMKIISGEYKPTKGSIFIEGKERRLFSPLEAQREGISLVHQEISLVPQLTVYENIFLGRWGKNRNPLSVVNKKIMKEKARNILERLGAEHISVDAKVDQLSLGDRQIVEIAKALSTNPKVLILDEPTAALSLEETERLFRAVKNLKSHNVTVLYISHRLEEIFEIADRVSVLRDGELVFTGNVNEVTIDKIVSLMIGRNLENRYPPKPQKKIGEALLKVSGLTSSPFFKNISFELRKGEILGVTGLVGCGNTQLGETLFGLRAKESGEIIFEGQKLVIKKPLDSVEQGIFYVPGDRHTLGLVLRRSLRENFSLANLKAFTILGVLNLRKEKNTILSIANKLNVKYSTLDQKVETLSGGNQQKVVIGKWLLKENVKLLILDEPTRGIDVGSRYEIYKLIYEMASRGIGILIISSDLDEVLNICDRIIVMSEGRITGELDPKTASKKDILILAVKKKEE